MIIRATRKVLNLNGIKPIKNDFELSDKLPGEWYVDLISLGKPGKFGLQFLHHPTKISVIVPGRSLSKIYSEFKSHIVHFLNRHGYGTLIERFDLESELVIYRTNDRSLTTLLSQIKWNTEHHCINSPTIQDIDFERVEDIYLNYLFTTKKSGPEYLTAKSILTDFLGN